MKTSIIILVLALALRLPAAAATALLLDVPAPKLTAMQAVDAAQKQIKNDPAYVLVGVQWCLPKSFVPPVSNASTYIPTDNADDYSWFVTYVFKNEGMAKLVGHGHGKYNWVLVIRVKKDGSIGKLISVST